MSTTSTIDPTRGASVPRELASRDRAREAAYFHEKDLENLRALTRKVKHAHAVQRGESVAADDVDALKRLVPELASLSEDAIERVLEWKRTT